MQGVLAPNTVGTTAGTSHTTVSTPDQRFPVCRNKKKIDYASVKNGSNNNKNSSNHIMRVKRIVETKY